MNEGAAKSARSPLFARRNRAGFSLFEMLVVLVILGVMAGVAFPALGRLIDGHRFRQQTRQFTTILRYARLLAVSKGEPVALRLDETVDECVFVLTGPVDERKDCQLDDHDVLVMNPGEFIFFPEGTATPGVIRFSRGERVARIRLDILTGRPEME